MNLKLVKIFVSLAIVSIVFAIPVFAESPCEILSKMNKMYEKGEHENAINEGKQVEETDRFGKDKCTRSVYATIATCYMLMGIEENKAGNFKKAAEYFKYASKYNRAFALSIDCLETGDCKKSKEFWSKYLWMYE